MPRSPQWMDLCQIWSRVSSRGRNQLCGILLQSAHGFCFCDGSKFAISHWLGRSQLTQCWRHRAACDKPVHAMPSEPRYWLMAFRKFDKIIRYTELFSKTIKYIFESNETKVAINGEVGLTCSEGGLGMKQQRTDKITATAIVMTVYDNIEIQSVGLLNRPVKHDTIWCIVPRTLINYTVFQKTGPLRLTSPVHNSYRQACGYSAAMPVLFLQSGPEMGFSPRRGDTLPR